LSQIHVEGEIEIGGFRVRFMLRVKIAGEIGRVRFQIESEI